MIKLHLFVEVDIIHNKVAYPNTIMGMWNIRFMASPLHIKKTMKYTYSSKATMA